MNKPKGIRKISKYLTGNLAGKVFNKNWVNLGNKMIK
jgi:hypothetical protein